MPEITFCLLNYRRPANLPLVVESIRRQTVPCRVFLWDNGTGGRGVADVDWWLGSSQNVGCWPRWWMATQADTPLVATLDDDLALADRHVMADALRQFERLPSGRLLGAFGVSLGSGGEYRLGRQVGYGRPRRHDPPVPVDIVKGRHVLARADDLRAGLAALGDWNAATIRPHRARCDDIVVSAAVARGCRAWHRVAGCYGCRLDELPDHDGLQDDPDHYRQRETAAAALFPPLPACADAH
jgi:hypothetical protein